MIAKAKFLMMVVLACSLGSAAVRADVVGLWRFDKNANPQPDSSKFGNNANVVDATWVNDTARGGVMEFEGMGDSMPAQWLEVDDSASLSIEETGLTIAAWANFAQFDTWNSIVGKTGANSRNKPSPYDVYTSRGGDGRVSFFVGSGGGVNPDNPNDGAIAQVFSTDPPPAKEWVHIAATLDEEGNVFHYLNGDPNGEGFIDREAFPLHDEDTNLFIGSRLDGTTNMDGRLDDVAIFNQSLTQAQIRTIMGGDFSAFGVGGVVGDYDGSGKLDVADIDALTAAVIANSTDTKFDANGDGSINGADRDTWINVIRKTWPGDSNLDSEFNSADFVQVFQRGQYEDTVAKNSKWGDGDWNGDAEFDSADFVNSFQAGGYEKGPRPAVGAVPEPAAWLLLVIGVLPMWRRARR